MNGPDVRYARRLLAAVLWLIVFDRFAPQLLRRLETRRYEATTQFRFENADLFGLGPLVSYLRENPHGRRRRIAFMGNSVIFGYALDPSDAVPAQFQKLVPGALVLNMAVNGSQLGSSYLITRAMIDSVDALFVQVVGEGADPMLPALIPVDDADVRDELPEDLNASAYVGPYVFPNNNRRRIPGYLYLGLAAILTGTREAVCRAIPHRTESDRRRSRRSR